MVPVLVAKERGTEDKINFEGKKITEKESEYDDLVEISLNLTTPSQCFFTHGKSKVSISQQKGASRNTVKR